MISREQSHPSALNGRTQGEMPFPALIQALYLGTKPGAHWTSGCLKLPEDMPDSVKELSCARFTARQFPVCVGWFQRKGGKCWHWEDGGESTLLDAEGVTFSNVELLSL